MHIQAHSPTPYSGFRPRPLAQSEAVPGAPEDLVTISQTPRTMGEPEGVLLGALGMVGGMWIGASLGATFAESISAYAASALVGGAAGAGLGAWLGSRD